MRSVADDLDLAKLSGTYGFKISLVMVQEVVLELNLWDLVLKDMSSKPQYLY